MGVKGDAHNVEKWFTYSCNEGALAVTEIFVEAFIRASGLSSNASRGDERALINFLVCATAGIIKKTKVLIANI
jgi:hypothetical protein